MGSEQLYLANRGLIEQAIAAVCRRNRLSSHDAEDFAGAVRLHLIEDDYAVLRKFQHRSSFKTYLLTVITHRYQDWRNARWGKWRPSAEARRQGPLAVQLERLVVRDGLSFEQAHETLRTNYNIREPRHALEAMFARFPARYGRQHIPEDELEAYAAPDVSADGSLMAREAALAARVAKSALSGAIAALPPGDRLILRMRFESGLPVVDIARALNVPSKPLYRRIDRILAELRQALEREGLTAAAASVILEEKGFDCVD